MNTVLKLILSMSFSGGLLIVALLIGKRFLNDKISRQWQYYIWLVVVLRLLIPFGLEANGLGKAYQAMDRAITQAVSLPQTPPHVPEGIQASASGVEQKNTDRPAEAMTAERPFEERLSVLVNHIWLIWLLVALCMLIRKGTSYQGFIRYIRAGFTPVSDMERLDRLSLAAEHMGIKRPVELCINPLISSPLLIGFFRPCIVLPSADISETDLQYIFLHELIHYKRRDLLFKWLVQITVCLHWFNPLVHLMSREIASACEFSCDEAVLIKTGRGSAQAYGKTLLDAMAAVGKYREKLGAVNLSGNKRLLKERLGAIMSFKEKSKATRLLTGALTLCVIVGASFLGVYPAAAASNQASGAPPAQAHSKASATQAEQYYEMGSLPLFELVFSRLDETEQLAWLEKLCGGGDYAFLSAALRALGGEYPLIASLAERAYGDGEIASFSVLTGCMDETELEQWLDRALEDGNWAFQSMLFDKLDMDCEKDALEQELEEQQRKEYEAVGVTWNGKNYNFQGQLAHIFLDIRPNRSFYTLDINPAGSVNVKIIRGEDGQITGAAYMTEAEATELLGDLYGPDGEDWDGE